MSRYTPGVRCVAVVGAVLAASAGAAMAQPEIRGARDGAASPVLGTRDEPWRTGRSAALLAILDEHVEWMLREGPQLASGRGDKRYNDRLEDVSPEAILRRLAEQADRLARLKALERSGWTEADHVDADLLRHELESALAGARFHPEQTPVNGRNGPQVWLPQMGDRLPFFGPQDYADFASRLEAVPRLIEQHMANMRAGLEAGRVPPRVVMAGAVEQCRVLAGGAESPTLSPFYGPYRALPVDDVNAARARKAIAEGIAPAFARLGDFLEREYLPKCRESIAVSEGADGPAAYDFALRDHTTLDVTADRVHEIGLAEVARIRAEMMEVIARTDWPRADEPPSDALHAAFLEYLRTDPRFYCQNEDELLVGYRNICKIMDAELPKLFRTLPRLTYGVREIPLFAAKTSPTAYYYRGSLKAGIPAWFMANTYRLDQRPKYEMVALALHEAVPGHHLQVALHEELEGVHPYRTLCWFTAYGEGWALYAERLGLEVGEGPRGLYTDPYDDFGRLTYEMWRACRLVVDTGMHAKGWTRQRAIDFMLHNTGLSALNIEREVDRYIAWPGQATAYKMGELKIRELRGRAESALGSRFDVREFHEAVLGAGPLPLPALEERVLRWIEAQGKE